MFFIGYVYQPPWYSYTDTRYISMFRIKPYMCVYICIYIYIYIYIHTYTHISV